MEDIADCKQMLAWAKCQASAVRVKLQRTFVEAVHIELPDKRRDVRVLEVLPDPC